MGQAAERLIKALVPDDLRDEAMTVVTRRNLLAHWFLRERAMFFGDPRVCNNAGRVLGEIEVKINELGGGLAAYTGLVGH